MQDNLSVDDFLDWKKGTQIEYATRTIEGRRLKMSTYLDGMLRVTHGDTDLYMGHDANKACAAWNAVINPPMSLSPDIIGSAITEPDEDKRNEARINIDQL